MRKLTHGLWNLGTLQVPSKPREPTISALSARVCFSKAPASMHQTHQEEESKADEDNNSHPRSTSGKGPQGAGWPISQSHRLLYQIYKLGILLKTFFSNICNHFLKALIRNLNK